MESGALALAQASKAPTEHATNHCDLDEQQFGSYEAFSLFFILVLEGNMTQLVIVPCCT